MPTTIGSTTDEPIDRTAHGFAGPVKRRLLLGGAVALGAAGVTGLRAWLPTTSTAVTPPAPTTQLQITAHPDDDLYFYNPDTEHAITAGHRVVTVCLTGGEADGRNGDGPDLDVDFNGYVAARYTGMRAAYAGMAGLEPTARWRREPLTVTGRQLEIATLVDEPRVQLVFCNLWEDSAKCPGSSGQRLMNLWQGDTEEHHTLTPTGGPVTEPTVFDRAAVRDTLVALLDRFRPHLVRTLDPDPDPQIHDDDNPQYADQDGYSDHIDHTAVALFTVDALHRWWSSGNPDTVVEAYRGYYNRRWPRNLSPQAYRAKERCTDLYAWNGGPACHDTAGCGDGKIGTPSIGHAFGASTVHRYPHPVAWLTHRFDGRPEAVAVRGGRLERWTGSTGTGWTRARVTGADHLEPVVNPVPGTEFVLAVTVRVAADPNSHLRTVLAHRGGPSGGSWIDLGNPDDGDSDRTRRRGLGTPIGVALDGPTPMIVARGRDRRPCLRTPDGADTWLPWLRLDGPVVQDGLAVLRQRGRVEIFGAAVDGVARWWRDDADHWHHEVLATVPPSVPPTVVPLPDDGALLVVRKPESASLVGYLRTADGWDTTPHDLSGTGGTGTIAGMAVPAWDGAVALATRNDAGTVGYAVIDPADATRLVDWVDGGPPTVGAPSLTLDADGLPALATFGLDGRLYTAAGTDLAGSGRWNPVDLTDS